MCNVSDLRISYHWQEGSVPPPYYYEYTIRVYPGLKGEIEFQPDYDPNSPPVWNRNFTLTPDDLAPIVTMLEKNQLLNERRLQSKEPFVGGAIEYAEINYCGRNIYLNRQGAADLANIVDQVFRSFKSLVPDSIWLELNTLREEYINAYSGGNR